MRSVQCKGKKYMLAIKLTLTAIAAAVMVTGCSQEAGHTGLYKRHHPEAAASVWMAAAAKPGGGYPHFPVRGIYVNANAALGPRMEQLIRLVDRTELNAMVLDVNSGVSLLNVSRDGTRMTPSRSKSAQEMRRLVRRLKQHHIYLIARIVTFKNAQLAVSHPEWAIRHRNGGIWKDAKGVAWIDPYRREAWAYPIALAKEAARVGFDEVQFDYVRFPENLAKLRAEAVFANAQGWSRPEAIRRFLHLAVHKAHQSGVVVSADVFGLVGSTRSDMGIGQSWPAISSEVDVISPMTYPSHYAPGTWGIPQPDLAPSAVIAHSVRDAVRQNRLLRARGKPAAQVRPWLQSFTATWIHPHQRYGPAQIREQVQAASRAGASSYLLWNSSSRYPFG